MPPIKQCYCACLSSKDLEPISSSETESSGEGAKFEASAGSMNCSVALNQRVRNYKNCIHFKNEHDITVYFVLDRTEMRPLLSVRREIRMIKKDAVEMLARM